MPEVLLVNPRKRSRRKTTAKKRRSPAKRKTTARRRRSPTRARRTRRTYRRNPIGKLNVKSFMRQTLMPSAVGAVGALGIDMIMGFLPLPTTWKTGPMRPAVKGIGAVAIGLAASMVTSRKVAEQITAGGLTVVLYDTMKTFISGQFPAIPLGQYDAYPSIGYVSPSPSVNARADRYIPQMNAYVDQGMGNLPDSLGALPASYGDYHEGLGAYVDDPAGMMY